MVRSKKLVAVAATGALVLAACGGSSDGGDTGDDPVVTDAVEGDEPETTEATETTEAMEEGDEPATTEGDEPETTEAMEEGDEPETTEATDEGDEPAASGAAFAVDTSLCEDPDAATAVIEDTIKIGTSIPLSGGPAVLFAPFGDGQQAYVDYYNAEFGGVNGQQLELVVKDDQYTADLTVANVDELVFDDEVDLISGVIGSPNNLAVQEDLNAQCIPQLNAATGAPNWGDVGELPWTTGLLVPYAVESQLWAEKAAADGATTAGIFYVNNEFGQAYLEAFTEAAEANGIEIVASETIEAADSGAPSGQVTNLAAANPDTILAVPLGAQCIAFMTEIGNVKAANPDFAASIYQTATCANPIFFGAVTNGGADGVFTSNNLKDVNDPAVAEGDEGAAAYLAAFAATGSAADPGGIAAAGWESMEVAVKAIQEAADAGNLSREGIINAARNVNYSSPLLLDGLTYVMNAEDGYLAEGTQLRVWSDADAGFLTEGDPVDFNGTIGVFEG
ncbi:MAG: ABC transporter substrate-binding protein [Ilumatobacter sp.]|uniref:ABC transporter substrate-binding protein n=2 Tax=Ilumatobacter sp. TaxID=1967498 RepID=UPI0032972D24